MLIGILTLITALCISAVAIYYSVAGLVAIFAAAAVPIIIMGGVLEVSKLVTAVWLHRNWREATWWLKSYLTAAVVVLMFITSMGIFGFLSKAHIEQTAGAQQSAAQIEQLEEQITYNQELITSANDKIEELQSSGSTVETNIREQIQQEQERIDTAYQKIQPAIQEQREIIKRQTQLYQTQIDKINRDLERLQGFINNDEIRKAQAVVGTTVDGEYGPNTAAALKQYQERKIAERNDLISKVETSLDSNTTVQRARAEIATLQERAARQVEDANQAIERLRTRLNSNTSNNIETLIDQQNTRIQEAASQVETLTGKKFEMESSYRQLEAEVGPLRYIAEFVYGEEAGTDLLEKAVQWVIITIIFVFDPLAVLLLIASQYSIERHRKMNPKKPKIDKPYASWLMSGAYTLCPEHNVPYPKGATCPKCKDTAPEENNEPLEESEDDLPLPGDKPEEVVEQHHKDLELARPTEAPELDHGNETKDTGSSDEKRGTDQKDSDDEDTKKELRHMDSSGTPVYRTQKKNR